MTRVIVGISILFFGVFIAYQFIGNEQDDGFYVIDQREGALYIEGSSSGYILIGTGSEGIRFEEEITQVSHNNGVLEVTHGGGAIPFSVDNEDDVRQVDGIISLNITEFNFADWYDGFKSRQLSGVDGSDCHSGGIGSSGCTFADNSDNSWIRIDCREGLFTCCTLDGNSIGCFREQQGSVFRR
ncbi:MAG: hypothetical protein WDZ29_05050 [Balneolaceae bacterium]